MCLKTKVFHGVFHRFALGGRGVGEVAGAVLALASFFPAPAFGQWSRDNLNTAVTGGGAVAVPVGGVSFANSANAVTVGNNTLLHGAAANGLPASVSDLVAAILNGVNGQKTQDISSLIPLVSVPVGAFSIPGMSYIDGGSAIRGTSTTDNSALDNTKWLITSGLTGNLGLEYLHFRNVTVVNTYNSNNSAGGMANGGLIGGYTNNTAAISMGNLTGNAFTGIGVTLHGYREDQYLAGGGVIGLRATGNSAFMGDIIGNVFKNINVTTDHDSNYSGEKAGSAYIEGGGVIGVDAVSSPAANPGHASINSLGYNLFTGIRVRSDDIILGGGVIGVNNNSQTHDISTTYAGILSVTGNIFGNGTLDKSDAANTADIYVKAVYSLRGGGVIGVNGLSNAAVRLDSLSGNVFAGIYVDTDSYLKGGGIVGVQSNDGGDDKLTPGELHEVGAYLGDVRGNLFLNQRVDVGSYLFGGGIVGVRSNQGLVALNSLQGNIFKGLPVNVNDASAGSTHTLDGGGIVGASALTEAAIVGARDNYFEDLEITVTGTDGHLRGGGVLGASASNAAATTAKGVSEVDDVTGNTFNNIRVTVGGGLRGGGVVGANSGLTAEPTTNYFALIPSLSGNLFSSVGIEATGDIHGGGIVGAHVDWITGGNGAGIAGGANLLDNRFVGLTVSAANITGGGIVGFDAQGAATAYLEKVSGNDFSGNSVETAGHISGGGALGVYSESGIAWIGEITDTVFQGLNISAGTYIDGGGIVGATGSANAGAGQLTGIGLIDRSFFANNQVSASGGQILGGAVYSYGSFAGMTIRDSVFIDNAFSSEFASGTPKVYGTVVVDTGLAGPDNTSIANTLTLTATAGNTTWFQNNRITEDSGSTYRANSLYFGTIDDPADSYSADTAESDAQLVVSPEKGGAVALYDPIVVNQDNASGGDRNFQMTVRGAGEFWWGGENVFDVGDTHELDSYAVGNTVTFESGSMTTLVSGMTLNAVAHDLSLDAGGRINIMGKNALSIRSATFNGHLHFNLNAATVNDADIVDIANKAALLTITEGTDSGDAYANLSGATVSLSNLAAGPALNSGDEFYLIQTTAEGDLDGDPANNTAEVRQGMTRVYTFIIDKNPVRNDLDADGANQNQLLVARLVSAPRPTRETRILAEGRIAGLAFLGQNANWLADHSYQQADLALRRGENRAHFGGVDYADVRMDTGSTVDYQGYTLVAGEAIKREKEDHSLLLGGFFEGGYGDYSVHGKFGHPDHPNVKGKGKLRYYGLGIMARQKWDSGLRLEGSLRGGRQENKFHSRDLTDVDGTTAKYKLEVPWFGAHLGVGHEWQKDEHNLFDLYLRYYWTHQGGKTVRINNDKEEVRFSADDSHRVRLGGRYTRVSDAHRSWYLGLAYEHEFDHRAKARSMDGDIDVPEPGGDGFVGEIGMILHPKNHDRLSLEFGLQGYTGKREGVSGGARLGWKF